MPVMIFGWCVKVCEGRVKDMFRSLVIDKFEALEVFGVTVIPSHRFGTVCFDKVFTCGRFVLLMDRQD